MQKTLTALTVAALLTAAGNNGCKKKEAPPPQPLEEELTEAVGTWAEGHWCEYRLTSAGGKTSEVTVALVGAEEQARGRFFWMEVAVTEGKYKVITKALIPQLERVSFLESGKDLTEASQRLIIKVGDAKAVELPLRELKLLHKVAAATGEGADLNAIFGGGEGVRTADAGTAPYETLGGKTLTCRKITIARAGEDEGYVLASDEVPIFGIAYSRNPRGELELVDYGTSGANSLIVEQPEKLDVGDIVAGNKPAPRR